MARSMTRPPNLPPFGVLVWDAFERLTRETGEYYGYQRLAAAINERRRAHAPPDARPPEMPATSARRIITGQRPTARVDLLREIIAVLGLDERTALLAAGRALPDVQQAAQEGRLPDVFGQNGNHQPDSRPA